MRDAMFWVRYLVKVEWEIVIFAIFRNVTK